ECKCGRLQTMPRLWPAPVPPCPTRNSKSPVSGVPDEAQTGGACVGTVLFLRAFALRRLGRLSDSSIGTVRGLSAGLWRETDNPAERGVRILLRGHGSQVED